MCVCVCLQSCTFIYNKYNGVWSWTDLNTTIKTKKKLREMMRKAATATTAYKKNYRKGEKNTREK